MTRTARARARRAIRAWPLLVAFSCATNANRAQTQAQVPTPPALPDRLRLSIQACASSPFDAAAYADLLRVELTALGIAAPGSGAADPTAPELIVASPSCDQRLVLQIRTGERTHDDTVRLDELPALGRERALALATVERLQRAWHVLATAPEAPATSPPSPANATPAAATPAAPAPNAASARTPPAPETDVDEASAAGQGALSVGLRISTVAPLASVGLNLDRWLSRRLALGGSLGWRGEHEGVAAGSDAHSVVLGPRLELLLLSLDVFELAAAVGLEAGVGWVVAPRAGQPDSRVSSAPVPLALAKAALGLRALLAYGLFAQLGVTTDFALIGATFETRGGQRLADLTGGRFAAFVGAGTRFGR
jgi:hypothetical protein